MAKTITVRVNNNIYELFIRAAQWDQRSISNFIEHATTSFILNEINVSNEEMEEIMEFSKSLDKWLDDVKKWNYEFVD